MKSNQEMPNNKKMNLIIVSDLHIGSRFFVAEAFEQFLSQMPEDCELVLNGDVINIPYANLSLSHRKILDRIKQLSLRQKVIWLQGNHDNGYLPDQFGEVVFKRSHSVGNRLLITHGDDFDEIMPRNQLFMKAFKLLHRVMVMLGARPVHVAEYAKKWKSFYKVLRKNVMTNAVKCAIENGYAAVICGHTHYAEDVVFNGVRYINTGAWTEFPSYFLHVVDEKMFLSKVGVDPDRVQQVKTLLIN
jgi:UDP-2,3-diacylglucosamine pyrophosphatase LpxH